eukprot:TRINITY_DN49670_c0_g1_i1.p1 TRINITY_DN49670_c0_g1~~TRINITY_DN49670_c0_g1_i1.p1  ORF type:complete len:415 (+),score=70.87 TRINITY_DN49670_c0_g1_i1:69-1313(+)
MESDAKHDFLHMSIKYYKMGAHENWRSSTGKEFRGGDPEAQKLCLDARWHCVVQNVSFLAWQRADPSEMILWCLAPDGGVLHTEALKPKPFKMYLSGLDSCAAQKATTALRKAGDLSRQQFFTPLGANGEPVTVSALRCALRLAIFDSASFRSVQECLSEYWEAINVKLNASIADYLQGMRCRQLAPGIYHIAFAHQLLMASSMLRIQERYECPCDDLRGSNFSLDEYKAWERKNNPGKGFTYYDRWPGFNVPGTIIASVFEDGNLLPREKALKQLLQDHNALQLPNFYVIGTTIGDEQKDDALFHEICHAMYEMYAGYRADVDSELDAIPDGLMLRMKAWLLSESYPNVERILRDEVQAYLCEGDRLGCKPSATRPLSRKFRAIFLKHAGEDLAGFLPEDLPECRCNSDTDSD